MMVLVEKQCSIFCRLARQCKLNYLEKIPARNIKFNSFHNVIEENVSIYL